MKRLFPLLLLKIFLLSCIAWWSGIGLGPDEAQYWTWSERLSIGYYSKPPGIAWQIAAGTLFLGDKVAGVRLFAQIFGFLFPLILYQIALKMELSERQAFFAGLITAFSPLGWLASLFAITDGGLILFWSLAIFFLLSDLKEKKSPDYLKIGAIIALGALFKWPIYLLWLFIFGAIPFIPRLWNRHLFGGIILSLSGLLPSFIWNASHNWVTFRHVEATIVQKNLADSGATVLMAGNFWDFFGAQAALLSPILFVILMGAVIYAVKNWKSLSDPLKFCFIVSIPPLTLFLIAAIFKKMQGNWCQFAYPGAILLIAWYGSERWMKWGLALSCSLVLLVFSLPQLLHLGLPLPYKMNPFKHNIGWEHLAPALVDVNYDPSHEFLFSDKYQTTAILWFYGPEQKPSYFLNLQNLRLNQFSFWPGMAEEQLGKTGIFVFVENEPHLSKQRESVKEKIPNQLMDYFSAVEFLGEAPLFGENKKALFWRCYNYNGKEPALSGKY